MVTAVAALLLALAHPLHTTLTELTEDAARGTVRATIRVFADDFGKVTAKGELPYVLRSFALIDARGRPVSMQSCGIRRTAELVWVCVEASAPGGLRGMKVRSGILCDLYDDQVNVVQASVSGARKSLLFIKGDAAKAL